MTFFFSQAQAESESLSGNVKWVHRENFKDRTVYYQYKSFLGYRRGPDGAPEIDEEQAAVVHRIFARYLMGDSIHQIVRELEADGIKTVRGRDKWSDSVIHGMLQNEKYMGDALLQMTYVSDIFTHQSKKNMGELPKYYVHDCHLAIIDRETFRRVQEEIARRGSKKKTSSKAKTELGKYSGKYALSELLICGECGNPYRRQAYMPKGEKYYVWRCLNRMENGRRICKNSPTFILRRRFRYFWNSTGCGASVSMISGTRMSSTRQKIFSAKAAIQSHISTAGIAAFDVNILWIVPTQNHCQRNP